MIKFFRKIRQRLVIGRKFNKYLIYAVGEIILVVIGILIALQINNWNTDRKLRNLENELLYDIQDNLIASTSNIEASILFNKETLTNLSKILNHINDDLPYNNSLDSAFAHISYWSEPNFTYTAYESLKSRGLNIIQNDSIKKLITEIYEQTFPLSVEEHKAEWELFQSVVVPFLVKNIQSIDCCIARPFNFDSLKNSDEFHGLMGFKIVIRNNSIKYEEMAKDKATSLIEMIEKELERK